MESFCYLLSAVESLEGPVGFCMAPEGNTAVLPAVTLLDMAPWAGYGAAGGALLVLAGHAGLALLRWHRRRPAVLEAAAAKKRAAADKAREVAEKAELLAARRHAEEQDRRARAQTARQEQQRAREEAAAQKRRERQEAERRARGGEEDGTEMVDLTGDAGASSNTTPRAPPAYPAYSEQPNGFSNPMHGSPVSPARADQEE